MFDLNTGDISCIMVIQNAKNISSRNEEILNGNWKLKRHATPLILKVCLIFQDSDFEMHIFRCIILIHNFLDISMFGEIQWITCSKKLNSLRKTHDKVKFQIYTEKVKKTTYHQLEHPPN